MWNFTNTYNKLGQRTVGKFIVHKIENEIIKDVTFAINGDKILFTWSGKKKDENDYNIYAVSYNLSLVTDIGTNPNSNIVSKFELSQNYPNPFNPSTTIQYSIPSSAALNVNSVKVILRVYDILGREVATLVNKSQRAGNYEVQFDADKLTSGIYFSKLQYGDLSSVRKMILLK